MKTEKKMWTEQSKRNHEIINSHEVFQEDYIYKNFKLLKEKKEEVKEEIKELNISGLII